MNLYVFYLCVIFLFVTLIAIVGGVVAVILAPRTEQQEDEDAEDIVTALGQQQFTGDKPLSYTVKTRRTRVSVRSDTGRPPVTYVFPAPAPRRAEPIENRHDGLVALAAIQATMNNRPAERPANMIQQIVFPGSPDNGTPNRPAEKAEPLWKADAKK